MISFSFFNLNNNCVYLLIGPLAIEFSQSTFVSSESSTNITVTLVLDGGTSSSDITITVILSEQSPLSAEGKKLFLIVTAI